MAIPEEKYGMFCRHLNMLYKRLPVTSKGGGSRGGISVVLTIQNVFENQRGGRCHLHSTLRCLYNLYKQLNYVPSPQNTTESTHKKRTGMVTNATEKNLSLSREWTKSNPLRFIHAEVHAESACSQFLVILSSHVVTNHHLIFRNILGEGCSGVKEAGNIPYARGYESNHLSQEHKLPATLEAKSIRF